MSGWLSSFVIVSGVAMVLYIMYVIILNSLGKLEIDIVKIQKDISTLNEYLQDKYWKDDKS